MGQGYEGLRTRAASLDLSARGKIFAAGRDRVRLLHAVTSNDIKSLSPGSGCYAFLLNPQGRIQGDINLLCLEDRFLLDTEPESRERIFLQIKKYIIADDVKLEDLTAQMAAIAIEGPRSADVLAAIGAPFPESEYSHQPWNDAIVQRVSFTGAPGFRIFIPDGGKSDLIRQLESAGAASATMDEARVVRLEHARPRYTEDIFEMTLPQETQQMHAVSFTKGCYLGQEIVERIRARGHVNRLLVGLEIDASEPPAPGTKLYSDAGEIGEMTSAAFSPALGRVVALGYVRTQYAQPGTSLSAGNLTVKVRAASS